MDSNFDKNFESNKSTFKQKFGIDWNENPQLYLTYIQTLYVSTLTEIANNGMSELISRQRESHSLLQDISRKLK
ncbi:MAG TPA: hypothetical protein DHV28_06705 [Ignavibacteriales bacterium]|nr:hypothetical protein [Ignavibacteriales bacterium]